MGKASQAKKVNRAAATGGGRTGGSRAPVGWYSAVFVVVVVGVLGVFMASKNISDKQAAATTSPPVANKDHWHAAYGFNICGKWADPLNDARPDASGIHTHGDGLVHTHPFVNSAAGKGATFGKMMVTTDTKLTATSFDLKREGEKRQNGDKCGKKTGVLTARVFKNLADKTGKELQGNPASWRIVDGSLITVSFNPKGFKVTQPPSAGNLKDPGDVLQAPTTLLPEPPADETATTTEQ